MNYYFTLTEEVAEQLASRHFFLAQRKEALQLKLGKSFYFSDQTTVGQFAKILSGNHIFSLGHYSYAWSALPSNTLVGNYCSIAAQVVKRGLEHPYQRFTTSAITYEQGYPPSNDCFMQKVAIPAKNSQIIIQDDVWIGAYAMLKPGITIHTGSIVAARANVTKDVPPYAIVGGNPAKVIKMRCYDSKIITLYNEAYNANPLSMTSALAMFDEVAGEPSAKLVIIGDMLELGDNSQQYHLDLVPYLSQMGVREVVLVGQMSKAVADALTQAGKKSRHFANATDLKAELGKIIQDGDTVLIKASNGIGLQGIFAE